MKNSILSDLKNKGYVLIRESIAQAEIDLMLTTLKLAKTNKLSKQPTQIRESENLTNLVYKSDDMPNMSYCYLKTEQALDFSNKISRKLSESTGLKWNGNGNYLPIFEYFENSHLESHRDWDIGFGTIDYIAIAILTKPSQDFTKGRFYINKYAEVTPDGRKILYEDKSKREYFNLQPGNILIIDNHRHVHGVEQVEQGKQKTSRVTISWRLAKQ